MNMEEHAFIGQFADVWKEATLDSLMTLLADDVVLIQPLSPPLVGKSDARKAFAKILYQYPGMYGEDVTGLGEEQRVLISWTMCVPIGRRELRVPVVDDFELEDGLVTKRTAYFDTAPIVKMLLTQPAAWPRQVRAAFKNF